MTNPGGRGASHGMSLGQSRIGVPTMEQRLSLLLVNVIAGGDCVNNSLVFVYAIGKKITSSGQ